VDTSTAAAINSALQRSSQPVVPAPTPGNSGNQSSTKVLYSIKRTLKSGISGSDIITLQNALKKLGYYTYGKTTTYFGSYTRTAVLKFQRSSGLKATGIVDAATASAINKVLISKTQVSSGSAVNTGSSQKPGSSVATAFKLSRNLKMGISGSDVKQLQDILIKLGYLKAKSTGYYGSSTYAAVKAFQKANKITQTGIVSTATAAAVNKALN
jgi:peptidoglycan hydrolase-like protein with peptidoglycan-binding domain